ncbi:hypothetical protein GQ602_003670 [Ophiocordyceps camponoti-floridani]|uniref:Uncharacterized protein n=1 Tax=Ophiocordyceps camponoti-floridani TaxID=2030778 RepID=A0A8H4Q8P0_9HYPO|nr:hypothetical protein GQ602_003670 [Ophiocordyceps camponoti-floridani]
MMRNGSRTPRPWQAESRHLSSVSLARSQARDPVAWRHFQATLWGLVPAAHSAPARILHAQHTPFHHGSRFVA